MPPPYRNQTRSSPPGDVRARALMWLRTHSSPRLLMSLMLASTMGSGFLASFLLLHAGVHSPLARYPLSVLFAWAVFLALVSVWVWWHRRAHRAQVALRSQRAVDGHSNSSVDLPIGNSGSSGGASGGGSGGSWGGGGGRFGGGGASDTYGEVPVLGFGNDSSITTASSSGLDLDFDFGGDDLGAIVLLIVAAIVAAAVLGMAFYVVYSAPTFFAELLVDGGVGTWLYKRSDVTQRADWLSTAMRRSVLPVLVVLALFVGLALTMQHVAPGSATLVQAWGAVTNTKTDNR